MTSGSNYFFNKKKIFSIIFFSVFYCNLSFAGCTDDIDFSWNYFPGKVQINFEFLNNKNKKIKITEIRVSTADNQVIRSMIAEKKLYPFGKSQLLMSSFDLNTKVIASAGYTCVYE